MRLLLIFALVSVVPIWLNAQTQWSSVQPIDPNAALLSGSDNAPYVAAGGNGTWIAVWVSEENLDGTAGTDGDIFFSRSVEGRGSILCFKD